MKLSRLAGAILLANVSLGMASVYAADAPTLKDVLGASGITITGYVDAAYTHLDAQTYRDDGTGSPIATFGPNYFDENNSGANNAFALKQASITIAKQPSDGFGALVNLTTGSDATFIHSNGAGANDYDVTQAFVQYAGSGLTVIGGKFNTLAGAEVIAPTGNTNISRSIAFLNALPFTHTGVRVSYAPASNVTLYLGSNNGWDAQKDTNKSKTTELGISFTPTDMISAAVYAYSGGEGSPAQTRTLIDTVITIKPTKELALVLNYDMGQQKEASTNLVTGATENAKWDAINVYVNYQFTDKLRTSLRLEQFNDKGVVFSSPGVASSYRLGLTDGADPVKKVNGVTLTLGYAAADNFELRGEVRQDKADKEVYSEDGTSFTSKQMYFAVEGLYKF